MHRACCFGQFAGASSIGPAIETSGVVPKEWFSAVERSVSCHFRYYWDIDDAAEPFADGRCDTVPFWSWVAQRRSFIYLQQIIQTRLLNIAERPLVRSGAQKPTGGNPPQAAIPLPTQPGCRCGRNGRRIADHNDRSSRNPDEARSPRPIAVEDCAAPSGRRPRPPGYCRRPARPAPTGRRRNGAGRAGRNGGPIAPRCRVRRDGGPPPRSRARR